MVRVIGIDPGTKSFDLFGIDDDDIILDVSICTEDIVKNPQLILDTIKKIGAELIVGPSGFGIPITHINDIKERELFLMSLIKKEDKKSILGMRKSIEMMKKAHLPVYFIPGVIHLPTVPYYRKLNKIDMGTSDKLCCAVLGIYDQALRHKKAYNETSFIMLEMGFGYTASTAVKDGKIIDGIGGSLGNIGFVSLGSMDAELAYLLGKFDKELIFRGGVKTLTDDPEKLMENEIAMNAYIEGAVKDIMQLTVSVKPLEIFISGRISRVNGIFDELKKRIDIAPLKRIEGFKTKNVKEAAQGAGLIANGLAGGKYKEIIDVMELREAKGTCLDYILLPEIDVFKHEF